MKITGTTLFQYSTISALMGKDLYGSITFAELLTHGNFGLGTFHATDGELIVLDNKAYQMLASGEVKSVSATQTSPFASLTNFKVHDTLKLTNVSYQQLEQKLLSKFPSLNLFYAIKMTGVFPEISVRTVTKQNEPFVSLKEAVKVQKELTFNNVTGDLVMFWTPSFANTIGVEGFHSHFISSDRKQGGHVFNFQAANLDIEICYITNVQLQLPTSASYLSHQVDKQSLQDDIKKAESVH